ncbi:type V CRISPR-associated protein Cas12k, partial [Leptolyngbya sp. GGD]|uniref:type V CRISPR-associated protein Cas12k n=1 Tax=Leptolyngbya sp. GGD TaxID=2997907 RepID=UPI00227C1EFF
AEVNLVEQLLEIWQRRGTVTSGSVKELCDPLKAVYPSQPGRFYASANQMVTYTYQSWLALQQTRRRRLDGKQRWLDAVKSDAELLELSGSTLEAIRQQAQAILDQVRADDTDPSQPTATKRKRAQGQIQSAKDGSLIDRLFKAYDATDNMLSRCAIAYLLKNDCEVSTTEENPEKFAHRIHRKQKEIEQLEAQLQARLPKERDLTGEVFLETLAISTQQLPETVAQAQEWQAKLLTRPASLPYPIIYGSATDIYWGKTAKGRITVTFNGMDKYLSAAEPDIKTWFKTDKEYPFRLACDQRQLPFFQRFLEDWQAYQANKGTYPAGLLTLSSALLGWREGEGKGDPWNVNHLALYCTFDTRLMTAEGTLEAQQEKIAKTLKKLTHSNPDPRNHSTLDRLQNLPERPSRTPYVGNPEILVGISIGLTDPITVAVVNGRTGEILAYRTPRALLGEQYCLLNRHRKQQQQNRLQRHKNQQRSATYQPSESELGQYVDQLLANSTIDLARTYQAGSIVVPNLKNVRDLLASEIQARAEEKCPGSVAAQKQYAKAYRLTIHQWSYNRLIQAICSQATQRGITVEVGSQPLKGNPQELAKDIAIAAYHARAITAK